MDQIISELQFETLGEGFIDITNEINKWINSKKILQGILVLSTKHTSCSLIINENADPNVLKDLSSYIQAIVPEEGFFSIDGKGKKKMYIHSQEGKDDMPAHIRTMLTCTSISLSINESNLVLGTWQAVYLWEHRYSKNLRSLQLHAIAKTI